MMWEIGSKEIKSHYSEEGRSVYSPRAYVIVIGMNTYTLPCISDLPNPWTENESSVEATDFGTALKSCFEMVIGGPVTLLLLSSGARRTL